MDINDFINTAVKQVRDSKKKGKAGKKARNTLNRNAREGQEKVAALKAEIKAIAQACERKEWKETALVMYKSVATCNCCGEEKEVCTEGVYIEKTHKKLGKIHSKIEKPHSHMYPSLPRRIETLTNEHYLCATCFAKTDLRQMQLPGLLHDTIRDCKQIPVKQLALYRAEEKRFQKMCWNAILPPTLPLLPSPENIQ